MARTLNGKCTGTARRIELAEERENLARQMAAPRTPPPPCKICGGVVEPSPMFPNMCYGCYRDGLQAVEEMIMLCDLLDAIEHVTLPDYDSPDQAAAAESRRISEWLSDNWDTIPEVEF